MFGVNLLLLAWWSFAMWVVTRMSTFVEARLRKLTPQEPVPGLIGQPRDDSDTEDIRLDAGLLSGSPTTWRARGIAGIRR